MIVLRAPSSALDTPGDGVLINTQKAPQFRGAFYSRLSVDRLNKFVSCLQSQYLYGRLQLRSTARM